MDLKSASLTNGLKLNSKTILKLQLISKANLITPTKMNA